MRRRLVLKSEAEGKAVCEALNMQCGYSVAGAGSSYRLVPWDTGEVVVQPSTQDERKVSDSAAGDEKSLLAAYGVGVSERKELDRGA